MVMGLVESRQTELRVHRVAVSLVLLLNMLQLLLW